MNAREMLLKFLETEASTIGLVVPAAQLLHEETPENAVVWAWEATRDALLPSDTIPYEVTHQMWVGYAQAVVNAVAAQMDVSAPALTEVQTPITGPDGTVTTLITNEGDPVEDLGDIEDYLGIEAAAAHSGHRKTDLRRWARKGKVTGAQKVFGHWGYTKEGLDALPEPKPRPAPSQR